MVELEEDLVPEPERVKEEELNEDGVPEPETVLDDNGELLVVLVADEVDEPLSDEDVLLLLELLAEEIGDWDDAEELEADDVRVGEIHCASRTGPHVTFTPNAQNVQVVQADAALIDE